MSRRWLIRIDPQRTPFESVIKAARGENTRCTSADSVGKSHWDMLRAYQSIDREKFIVYIDMIFNAYLVEFVSRIVYTIFKY